MENINKIETEEELYAQIEKKRKFLRENDFKMAPLEVQAVLDEITELEMKIEDIGRKKLTITPVLDAPLVKNHPRMNRSNLSDNRMRLF